LRFARLLFLASLRHQRRLRDRLVARDHEIAEHGVAEAERADELVERRLVDLDVQQQVMGLVNLGDRVRELAAPPVFLAMNLALRPLDEVAIPLEHRGHLFTLVRVDQKHDFVVSQSNSPWVESLPTRGEARSKTPIVRFRGWRILLARARRLNRKLGGSPRRRGDAVNAPERAA